MIFRKATPSDVPAIVSLLKLSLGEGLIQKSETYWNWKHIDNPFGASAILLADEDDQLIGVRAFMRWNWESKKLTYKSLRAVDTVVHPKFQGKGVFKKLTMALREQCRSEGFDFIFNTPNTLSRPGYLKMGWQDIGRIRIRLKLHLTLGLKTETLSPLLEIKEAVLQYKSAPQKAVSNQWQTCISTDYLLWRYANCPVVKYYGFTHPRQGWLLIGYPKRTSKGVELRITEWLPGSVSPSHHEFHEALHLFNQKFKPSFVTISPNRNHEIGSLLLAAGFLPGLPLGPKLTYCALSDRVPAQMKMADFYCSLGDMELF
jgi:GNAT superfamily N-acetyltransferase